MFVRKYSRIMDYIFLTIGIIILTFCWIRFYTHNSTISIILSITLGISLGYLIFHFNKIRLNKQNLSANALQRIQSLDFQLSFANTNFILQYFNQLLPQSTINTSQNCLILPNDTLLYPHYLSPVDDITIRSILSTSNTTSNIIIVSNNFDKNTTTLCRSIRNIHIQLLTTSQFLDKICNNPDFEIPKIIDTSKPKLTFRQIMLGILDRKKSKTYLILGLLLLFYSFFIPLKIYYLIFGSILILLCILSRFFPTS